MIEKLYTIEEVAEILHVARKTVYKWICARKITVVKGKPVLIPESSLKTFIAKKTVRAII
ncbi:MAG: hypothetical protein A2W23_08690 [Planctomycetes bacterium RBG_16_43_13]|nr:MAG: hypothetical protein A2W23_08690 [Planctomycetes bacterium RBG_16_43_13]